MALLRFHGELMDLLRTKNAEGIVEYPVGRRASIKDMAESLGVPHSEIFGVRRLERELDFSYLPGPGDVLDLWPASAPVDVTRHTRLRSALPRAGRFLVDENVAGLVPLLRGLGLDTVYDRTWSDAHIAETAFREARVLLSRDRALLKRSCVQHGRLVRSQQPDEQLVEVLALYPRPGDAIAFTRCLRCNCLLQPVAKERIRHRLEPRTKRYYDRFRICPGCDRLYWPGSHQRSMWGRYVSLGVVDAREIPDRLD